MGEYWHPIPPRCMWNVDRGREREREREPQPNPHPPTHKHRHTLTPHPTPTPHTQYVHLPVWPCNFCTISLVCKFQIYTMLSSDPDTIHWKIIAHITPSTQCQRQSKTRPAPHKASVELWEPRAQRTVEWAKWLPVVCTVALDKMVQNTQEIKGMLLN